MGYKHIPTDFFLNSARDIKKDYPEFGNDLKKMRKSLDKLSSFINQPHIDALGHGLFKLRLEITGKPASKTYGARIIFFFIAADREVWYLTCYDKSDAGDITPQEFKKIKEIARQIAATKIISRLLKFGSKTLGKRSRSKEL